MNKKNRNVNTFVDTKKYPFPSKETDIDAKRGRCIDLLTTIVILSVAKDL